jgi:hypothetical protein
VRITFEVCQKKVRVLGKNIYLRLKTHLPNAVKNAQTLSAFNAENPNRGYTEMHKLFEAIGLKF